MSLIPTFKIDCSSEATAIGNVISPSNLGSQPLSLVQPQLLALCRVNTSLWWAVSDWKSPVGPVTVDSLVGVNWETVTPIRLVPIFLPTRIVQSPKLTDSPLRSTPAGSWALA